LKKANKEKKEDTAQAGEDATDNERHGEAVTVKLLKGGDKQVLPDCVARSNRKIKTSRS